jgi:multicomponent Na+:H+ antiporter subunit C
MIMIETLLKYTNYLGAMALFIIGLYTVLTHNNLLKRVIGINIMETSVFLFFVSIGMVAQGQAPILKISDELVIYINPLPSALILTGIVVAVSITAYSLSLIVQLYREYKTMDMDQMLNAKDEASS